MLHKAQNPLNQRQYTANKWKNWKNSNKPIQLYENLSTSLITQQSRYINLNDKVKRKFSKLHGESVSRNLFWEKKIKRNKPWDHET